MNKIYGLRFDPKEPTATARLCDAAGIVKKKGRRIFTILRPFPVGRCFIFHTALSQAPFRVGFLGEIIGRRLYKISF